ncbi:hypothetical protein N9W11_03665 [Psychrosphaera haliotis]|nr:hypothetical protein [Psychrosphaera haliotis]
MKIEFEEADKEYILNDLAARLREIGSNYSNSLQEGLEIRALKVAAHQFGHDLETLGGNKGLSANKYN